MRRLAAILAADVAGYSRLMQEDDQGTLAALTAARKLFADTVAAHGGRVVNAPGDSILAEFAAVADAVDCALAFRLVRGGEAPRAPAAAPRQNAIAVLAFDNMTGDPAQGNFCDGISEDIITDLSKTEGVAVINRQSSFSYKGKAADPRAVGRELGVQYVLRGSVRMAGNRVRVTALIDATTGEQLWGNRYDRALDDVFLVGGEITEDIVTSLDVRLSRGEETRIWRKAMRLPAARDLFNEALNVRDRGTPQDVQRSRELFLEAARLEPDSPWPYGQAAVTHAMELMQGWTRDRARSLEEARALALKSCELEPTVAAAYAALGVVALSRTATTRRSRSSSARARCGLCAPGRVPSSATGSSTAASGTRPPAMPPRRWGSTRCTRSGTATSRARRGAQTQPFRDKGLRERYLESLRKAGLPA